MIPQSTLPYDLQAPQNPENTDLKAFQSSEQEKADQLVEFEQALIALQGIPNIANPCMKRTMNVGPKKFVGKKSNP